MKTTYTKIISICLVVVALGLVLWFTRKSPNDSLPRETTEPYNEGSSTTSIPMEKDTSVPRGLKDTETKNKGDTLPLAPDLSKPIIIKAQLTEAVREENIAKAKEFQNMLTSNPSYYDGWLMLGIYRKELGDYDGAAEAWLYASKLQPNRYVAYNNLGDLYHIDLKNFPLAEKNMLEAIRLKPDYIQGYRNLYDLYVYSYKEKSDKADDILKDGLAKNPDGINLAISLGKYYLEAGGNTSARIYYDKAIEIAKSQNNSALADELAKESKGI